MEQTDAEGTRGSVNGEGYDVGRPTTAERTARAGVGRPALSPRMAGRRRPRRLAGVLTVLMLLSACTGDDPDGAADSEAVEIDDLEEAADPIDPIDPDDVVLTVATHADALEAMADSLAAGSWRWSGAVETTFTAADLDRVASFDEYLSPEELRRQVAVYDAFSAHGALGEDGSWQSTLAHRGRDIVDARMSGGELYDASTLEPDVTMLLRVDLHYIVTEWWDELTYPGAATSPDEEIAEVRREAAAELEGSPFLDIVLAIIDGGWGGLSGVIDLAAFGVTQEDLDDSAATFREELIGLADRDTTLDLVDRSVTLRDFAAVGSDGGSIAVLDVHPEAAAFAMYDLFDDAAAIAGSYGAELPETLEAVATVTFDADGLMTEVSTDIVAIMRQAGQHLLATEGPDAAGFTADELAVLDELEGTAAVVFRFSDHGQVPTVLDVPDAVTVGWGELAELIATWISPYSWDEGDWEAEWDDGEWDDGQWDEQWDGDDGGGTTGSNAEPGTDPFEAYFVCVEETDDVEACAELLDRSQ